MLKKLVSRFRRGYSVRWFSARRLRQAMAMKQIVAVSCQTMKIVDDGKLHRLLKTTVSTKLHLVSFLFSVTVSAVWNQCYIRAVICTLFA